MRELLTRATENWAWAALALGVCGVIAYAAAEAVARAARSLLLVVSGETRGAAVFSAPIVRRPIRVTRAVVFTAVLLVLLPPALSLAGIRVPQAVEPAALVGAVLPATFRILLIGLLTYLVIRIISAVAARIEHDIGDGNGGGRDGIELAKRARTLSRLVQNGLNILVMSVATLMILRQLDVDIMPILTGAGIVGLAVGFGAQTLVKDFISGFFLILENNIRVGDVAKVNGTGGLVEAVNLRTVVLRDLEGVVHVFPNGSIETLANLTKDYAFALLDVGVAYKEDTDRVVQTLREVGADLQHDAAFGPNILEPLEVLGVDAFGDSQVTIKVRFKTMPLKQWEIAREMRRRIKKRFDTLGIEIPFPHVSVYFGEASRPFQIRSGRRSRPRPTAAPPDSNGGSATAEGRAVPPPESDGGARRSADF